MADPVEDGATTDEVVEGAWRRLVVAAARGSYNEVKASLHRCTSKINEHTDDWYGYTALLYAVISGSEACVKLLLENGADPSLADSNCNQTPILLASRYGQFHLIPLLIGYKSPVDTPDEYGQTALQWAAWKTHVDCLQVLRMGGESILDGTVGYGRYKSLLWAADDVDVEPLLELIRYGANIYAKDNYSGDAVLARCCRATQEIVLPYTKKMWLETSIHRCIYENDEKQLTTLLKVDATHEEDREEDRHTFDGWFSIHLAVYLHRTELVKLIIDTGYSAMYLKTMGERLTAMHIAAQKGFADIIELFAVGEKVNFVYDHDK